MIAENNLDLDEFLTKVGVVQLGFFSNKSEYDVTYQSFWTSSFFPTFNVFHPQE